MSEKLYRCVEEFQVAQCDGDGAEINDAPPVTIRHLRDAEAENARLRELVRDMYAFMALVEALHGSELHSRERGTWNVQAFERRMRELGMEVVA